MKRFLLLLTLVAALPAAISTGPDVGSHIPEFSAVDQDGRTQTFQSLRGPHGLLLMFIRSADW